MDEIIQQEPERDFQREEYIEGYQAEKEEDNTLIQSHLELRQWEIEPTAKQVWDDINKDSVFGNLEYTEMLAIRLGEDFYTALEALRSLQNNPYVAEFLLPDALLKSILRRKSSTLALSNSKQGFLRRLLQSKFTFKGYDFPQKQEIPFEPKSKWNFLKKKSKSQQEPQF